MEQDPEAIDDAVSEAKRRLRALPHAVKQEELPELALLRADWVGSDLPTLQLLASLVKLVAPRHIIELGCGVTTELLAHLACDHGRMAMTCFEHDPWAAAEFVDLCGGRALNYRWFSFCICPLVARHCGAELLPVYDDRMTVPTVPFAADLIVINGPPDILGGRAGAMYQSLKYARQGTIVLVLHIRRGEEAVIEDWMRNLDEHLDFVPPGLLGAHLAFIVRQPLANPFTLEGPHEQARVARKRAAVAAAAER